MTVWAGVIPHTARARIHAAYVIALLLSEAILLIILAKLIPKLIIGDEAEVLSVWAIGGALALGFTLSHALGERELSTRARVLSGLAATVAALQIIGRADLSESAAIWDLSWLIDLGSPSSSVWRQDGALDEFVAALTLIPIWFRGVALGSSDLNERPFTGSVLGGFAVLLIGFILGDNAGIESTVQITAVVWALTAVVTVALKHTSDAVLAEGGSEIQTGLTLAATLFALLLGIVIMLLLVVGIVAAIAGSGVVEPVIDALGFVLKHIVQGIAYILYPLFWLVENIVHALRTDEPPPEITILESGVGAPPISEGLEETEPDPTAGIVAVRVFGGIGAVLLFTLLAWLFFRRFLRRGEREDEERESVWSEADVLGDLLGGLRNLRGRFRRRSKAHQPDAPIVELYYEVLADAESRGSPRPPSRTPHQFAPLLGRLYDSEVLEEISNAFSDYRYAGREPEREVVKRLRAAWNQLREPS